MSWVDAPGPGDEVVTDKGVTVLVDRKASLFLIGTTMDYEVKALTSGLHLHQSEREGPLRLRREFPRLRSGGSETSWDAVAEPEVADSPGPNTVMERSTRPPIVRHCRDFPGRQLSRRRRREA